jgi:uncharacterized protein
MMKILFFALIAGLVYFMLKPRAHRPVKRNGAASGTESMVRCAHCGLNVPASECVEFEGRHFCSQEHRHLGSGGNRQQ